MIVFFIYTILSIIIIKKKTISKQQTKLYVAINYIVLLLHILLINENHLLSFFLVEHDTVLFTEVILETARGNFFHSPHLGSVDSSNYLAHHFSPILLIFVPIMKIIPARMSYVYLLFFFIILVLFFWEKINYKIHNDPEIYFISSIFPIFNHFTYSIFTSYHFELIILTLFIIFMWSILTKKFILNFVIFIMLLLSKEDVSLYLFLFSFVFLFQKRYVHFVLYSTISLLYFLYIPNFFQSYLDQSARINWYNSWLKYGNNHLEITINIVYEIIQNSSLLISIIKGIYKTLIPFLFLPLFAILFFLPSIPIYILHIVSDRIWYNSFYHYYSYPILPFLFYSFAYGLKNYQKIRNKNLKLNIAVLLFLFSYLMYNEKSLPLEMRDIPKDRVSAIRDVIRYIPPGSQVCVQFDLGMFLPRDNPIYPIKNNLVKDYILVDYDGFSPYFSFEDIEIYLKRLEENKKIKLIAKKSKVKLYKMID
jgi:uncharacterized membrane protein